MATCGKPVRSISVSPARLSSVKEKNFVCAGPMRISSHPQPPLRTVTRGARQRRRFSS